MPIAPSLLAPHARPDRDPPNWPSQPFRLQVATDAHTAAIDRLRERAYAKTSYFTLLDPRTVHRSTDSPGTICLALSCGDTLAATARITAAQTRMQAERVLEGDADLAPHAFPTIVMGRGATDPAFRGLGLMAYMAALGVRIAQQLQFGSASAAMYDGTPHLRPMVRAGWQVKPISGERVATVLGNAGFSLVYIGRLAFEDSIAHSAVVHGRLQEQVGGDAIVNDACRRIRSTLR